VYAAGAAWTAPWSEKSDVWSFGVTVWQIYSLGEVPYTLSVSESVVVERVKAGHLLPDPKGCSPDILTLMKMCWRYGVYLLYWYKSTNSDAAGGQVFGGGTAGIFWD